MVKYCISENSIPPPSAGVVGGRGIIAKSEAQSAKRQEL
jgi:hypothetical protein